MKKESYEKIIRYFESSKVRSIILEGISKILPLSMAIVYGCLCIILLIFKSAYCLRFIAVPALVLIFVTAFRTVINRRRPYEVMGYEPFLKYKEGKGKSFPSRHTASAFIIAFACLYLYPVLGIIMLAVAVIVAVSRVFAGMHYPSDVIAGFIISAIAALFGFIIL